MRLSHRLMFILCLLFVPPLLAQGVSVTTMTREDQLAVAAPTWSGETGLFTTVTGNTLRQGDISFGIYAQNFRLLAGPAPDFVPPSARKYRDYGYNLDRLSASVGFGLTDRWEISGMLPYDRIRGHGGDRAGFINGWLYQGRFSDSGIGDLHLATKFGFTQPSPGSGAALSLFADLPTGNKDSGISSGNGKYGLGFHWTGGIASVAASYAIVGKRNASHSNFPPGAVTDVDLPNEIHLDGGLNIPQGWWHGTNWISEVNALVYTGGDRKPKSPVFLVTGLRHWFGSSGWALNAAARWNVAKFSYDNDECRFTELSDCGVSGLVGLTFAPLHLGAARVGRAAPPPPVVSAPPPPPSLPPPPPAPAPVTPPEVPPVTPPRVPTEIRVDEIHFESGSARLTNIAKAILDDVALRMKQEPASTAIVIGYTDSREATGPNADLDRRRAEAVRDYLVSRHGIDPSRITIEGRDAREPVGDNNTAEGRLKNRRVVIRLMLP